MVVGVDAANGRSNPDFEFSDFPIYSAATIHTAISDSAASAPGDSDVSEPLLVAALESSVADTVAASIAMQ